MVYHGDGEGVGCKCGGRVRGVAKRRRRRLDDTEEETEMLSPFDNYKVLERAHRAVTSLERPQHTARTLYLKTSPSLNAGAGKHGESTNPLYFTPTLERGQGAARQSRSTQSMIIKAPLKSSSGSCSHGEH